MKYISDRVILSRKSCKSWMWLSQEGEQVNGGLKWRDMMNVMRCGVNRYYTIISNMNWKDKILPTQDLDEGWRQWELMDSSNMFEQIFPCDPLGASSPWGTNMACLLTWSQRYSSIGSWSNRPQVRMNTRKYVWKARLRANFSFKQNWN